MKLATSAPFAAALKREALERWPGGLVEYYGMTEGGGTCVLLAHERPDKLHTVGQPSEEHDIRLIDEDGREVKRGEVGEIVGRSPAMMNGYRNAPEKTRETEWRDAQGRRFIRTGDIGRFDEDGFLVLMDRRKDMIISGGFNIFPSDLEAALTARPEVREAAVVGAPSAAWGETPVGFVVLAGGRGGRRGGAAGRRQRHARQDAAAGGAAHRRGAAAQRHRQGVEARVARDSGRAALSFGGRLHLHAGVGQRSRPVRRTGTSR